MAYNKQTIASRSIGISLIQLIDSTSVYWWLNMATEQAEQIIFVHSNLRYDTIPSFLTPSSNCQRQNFRIDY